LSKTIKSIIDKKRNTFIETVFSLFSKKFQLMMSIGSGSRLSSTSFWSLRLRLWAQGSLSLGSVGSGSGSTVLDPGSGSHLFEPRLARLRLRLGVFEPRDIFINNVYGLILSSFLYYSNVKSSAKHLKFEIEFVSIEILLIYKNINIYTIFRRNICASNRISH
jgi:hypothetical protein